MAEAAATNPEALRWRVRLLQNQPMVLPVILITAVVGGVLGIGLFHAPLMGLLGFAMILASTADYWYGASYVVDAKGIQTRIGLSLSAMDWKDVKRVVIDPTAIKLTPLTRENTLDAFRGVVLRTTPSLRESVLDLVRLHVTPETVFEQTEKEFPR